MTGKDLQRYLDRLLSELPLNQYVERRFTAASETEGVPVDMDIHFRGMHRDREPKLPDILKHTRVLLLAEPGGGKSIIARAAAHHFISARERVPIFCELKEYRGDLTALMIKTEPPEILDPVSCIDGKPLSRAYVLDGVDEIPRGLLPQLAVDLQKIFDTDPTASVLLTARQAFYAAHRDMLPSITSLFHLLDFSDEDITKYVAQSNVDTNAFLAAVRTADATEEIRNPFILSVMIEKYREEGSLSDRRSDNLSYMIDRLIQSRRVNRQQQRRALKFLGVALETYSRNELTEEEAFRVIKQAMRISDADARALLDELYASILKRTANGLVFQMRSYGELLAAEALEDEPVGRVKELAFLDYNTPNDSWLNAVSYLVELNPRVRTYFVRQHSLWTISASPSVFPEEEKTSIVGNALEICSRERQYLLHHPLINVRRLSRFVTTSMENALVASLTNHDDFVRGNTIVLLGILGRPEALSIALNIVKDRSLGEGMGLLGARISKTVAVATAKMEASRRQVEFGDSAPTRRTVDLARTEEEPSDPSQAGRARYHLNRVVDRLPSLPAPCGVLETNGEAAIDGFCGVRKPSDTLSVSGPIHRPGPPWAIGKGLPEGLGRKKQAALHGGFLGVIGPPATPGSAHIFVAPDFPKSFRRRIVAVRVIAGHVS